VKIIIQYKFVDVSFLITRVHRFALFATYIVLFIKKLAFLHMYCNTIPDLRFTFEDRCIQTKTGETEFARMLFTQISHEYGIDFISSNAAMM